jgi:hypothetical protein
LILGNQGNGLFRFLAGLLDGVGPKFSQRQPAGPALHPPLQKELPFMLRDAHAKPFELGIA